MSDETRTVRDGRHAIRDAEAQVERIHMSPAAALCWSADWYLRKARLALRQAERAMADADDPRLPPLEKLRAQIRDRAPQTRPRRRRYRCPVCFTEGLYDASYVEQYACVRGGHDPARFEPVARRKAGASDA